MSTPRVTHTALWHLRMAVWHAENAMANNAHEWDSTDISDCRDAKETLKNLVDTFSSILDKDPG